MKTPITPQPKFSTGRGRPKNTIRINRNLTVSFQDYKEAVKLMASGKSLTKIERLTSINLKALRAIRHYATNNQVIPKKQSAVIANLKRGSKKVTVVEVAPKKEVHTPDLFDLIPDSNYVQAAVEEVKVPTPTPTMASRTLTIDFKGIIMQVEIASIEVKGDTVVVR